MDDKNKSNNDVITQWLSFLYTDYQTISGDDDQVLVLDLGKIPGVLGSIIFNFTVKSEGILRDVEQFALHSNITPSRSVDYTGYHIKNVQEYSNIIDNLLYEKIPPTSNKITSRRGTNKKSIKRNLLRQFIEHSKIS